MQLGLLWDAQLKAGWSEVAAKPWKTHDLKEPGEVPSWLWVLGEAQTEQALQGWDSTKSPSELKADAPSHGLFTQIYFALQLCCSLLLSAHTDHSQSH